MLLIIMELFLSVDFLFGVMMVKQKIILVSLPYLIVFYMRYLVWIVFGCCVYIAIVWTPGIRANAHANGDPDQGV